MDKNNIKVYNGYCFISYRTLEGKKMSDPEMEGFDEAVMSPKDIIVFKPRMEPNEPGKLNVGRTILISFAFLSALAALTYYNLAVPIILDDLIPEGFLFLGYFGRDTFIGILMTIDNILAVTLQPLFASLSDRTESKLGRRMPFIIIGVIGCAVFFGVAPWFDLLAVFVGMLFCYNIFMAFYRSPALAMVADYTEENKRSTASGLQQLIANIGTIIAFGTPIIVGFFVSKSLDKETRDVLISKIGFPVVSVFMLICLVILLFTVKETPTGNGFLKLNNEKIHVDCMNFEITTKGPDDCEPEAKKGAFIKIFHKKYSSLLLLLLAVFFWFAGFAAIEAFFSLIGTEYFGLDMQATPLLGLVYPVSMIFASLPTGLIGQKLGRKKTLYLCIGMLILSLGIVSFVVMPLESVLGLAIVMAVVGFFWMGVIVNTFPVVWKLCPKDEVSTFTGIYYTFNQSAAILGPVLMGLILDGFQLIWGPLDKYLTVYPFALGCIVIALIFLIFVRGGEASEEVEEAAAK